MKKFYFSKAYLTYLGFLTFGFSMTLLFGTCASSFNTALKTLIPIYVVAAISPLALKRIEADQTIERQMEPLLYEIKRSEDLNHLDACLQKDFHRLDD